MNRPGFELPHRLIGWQPIHTYRGIFGPVCNRFGAHSRLAAIHRHTRRGSAPARHPGLHGRQAAAEWCAALAVQLGITNATIKVHKSRVLEKMQATSLQQLAMAIQQLDLP